LSKRLPKLTATQRAYAFRHCFKHYAIKRANGMNICTECGHSWKSEHDLADTLCGCTCPHCGMELEALRTRKSVFSDNEYFSIVTTCKQYQVIRFFFVKSRYKAGQAAVDCPRRHYNDHCPASGYVYTLLRPVGRIQRHGDTQERRTSGIRYRPCLHLSPTAIHPRTETQRFQGRLS